MFLLIVCTFRVLNATNFYLNSNNITRASSHAPQFVSGNPPLSATHLNDEVRQKYKVLIKRHEQTVGLIGAKQTGGDAATGDIIVFFDCHVGVLLAR